MLKKQDLLLHHPYNSFQPVEELVHQAAIDENVLAIKLTLYRTLVQSQLIDSLLEAAKSGKEVTAVVELRARFDEADNIALANRLQEAGALVVYGVVGHKTHAKMILVVRRENGKVQRYAHLGTGNYHSLNAKNYSDFGLLTANEDITLDVHYLFQQLTGMGQASKMKKILHAPFTMHKSLLAKIKAEEEAAKKGEKASIIIKVNAITEPEIIKALYNASIAGVKINLIVRGICCLCPGINGVSDNIKVRSVLGRFLEHARIYYFFNSGNPQLYLSSADCMERNLFSRVEICFPIEDKKLIERIKKEALTMQLADNAHSWLLQNDGSYKKAAPHNEGNTKSVQAQLIEMYSS